MKKIAIIGASYLQVPLYLKAIELGIETIGFAWEEGAVAKEHCTTFYPISIVEKEEILKICQHEKIDGILTIASDVAVTTVNYVASKMKLTGNTIDSTAWCTHKFLMRQKLQEAGINSPWFTSVSDLNHFDKQRKLITYPCIVKPTDRSGSKGVTKIGEPDELENAVEQAIQASFSKQAILEEFIEGKEVSVEIISFKGKHYPLSITDKVTSGAPHFVELAHHQPSQLSADVQNQIYAMAKKGLNALHIENGASHSEFLINDSGIYVTEIGARMGGDFIGSDLVFLSTGYDFLKGVIDVALGKFEEPNKIMQKHSGVYFYSLFSENVKTYLNNHPNHTSILSWEINDEPLKPLTQSADRQGYFIYQSDKKLELQA